MRENYIPTGKGRSKSFCRNDLSLYLLVYKLRELCSKPPTCSKQKTPIPPAVLIYAANPIQQDVTPHILGTIPLNTALRASTTTMLFDDSLSPQQDLCQMLSDTPYTFGCDDMAFAIDNGSLSDAPEPNSFIDGTGKRFYDQ